MSSKYEIEIKSLLGTKENADILKSKILEKKGVLTAKNKQLNHYFVLTDAELFKKNFATHIAEEHQPAFDKIVSDGKKISVRTREAFSGDEGVPSKVIFVIKASIDDHTSSNGVSRMEFEQQMGMSLDELDQTLLKSGLEYQAKWSREREEYSVGDTVVCIDKNAGYGYLAEFEQMTEDSEKVPEIKENLLEIMKEFGVEELLQDRLERMFSHYNQNWRDYYGTDNVFTIQ